MRLTFIPAPFIKVCSAYRDDLLQYVIGGIYLPPSGNSYVRLWKINLPDLSNGGEIVFSEEVNKDDSVDIEITKFGNIIVTISEADTTNVGSTSQPAIYVLSNVFPVKTEQTAVIDQTARNMATNAQNTANVVTNNLLTLKVTISNLLNTLKTDLHL